MKITQYALAGICITFTLVSYLMFLAHRDSKMMNYYESTIERTTN
jgi:hypothetical protein